MVTRRSLIAAAGPLFAAGPRDLFDGASFAGWRAVGGGDFPAHCWNVADGCLHAQVAQPAFQDLRTIDEFEDFEFEFEWRIAPAGNSGVKYLIFREDVFPAKGSTALHARGRGFEYQLADDAVAPKPLEMSGALYEFEPPSRPNARPVGEFNQARIVRRGASIEHWLNGLCVVKLQLDSLSIRARMQARKVPLDLPRRSPIVLQNHSSEAWFRRLRIRAL